MPTELLKTLTDNQVALLGCLLALIVTGTLMSLSFYVGKRVRGETTGRMGERRYAVSLPLRETAAEEADASHDGKHRRTAA
jgi:hypothetical protein